MKKIKGFTLVELVIVIAIVIILSVVSVPIYRGYTKQAKFAEGYALLGVIFSAQKTYYSQYGNFLSGANSSSRGRNLTCNEEVLGIDARMNKYFTAFRYGVYDYDTLVNQFKAGAGMIEELHNGADNSCLVLCYNISSGSSFSYGKEEGI